jgi:hypothetical protein
MECIEDAIQCVNLLVFHEVPKNQSIPNDMWHFLTLMMDMVHGDEGSIDPGWAYEYYAYVVEVIENFASKDPRTFLGVRPP